MRKDDNLPHLLEPIQIRVEEILETDFFLLLQLYHLPSMTK